MKHTVAINTVTAVELPVSALQSIGFRNESSTQPVWVYPGDVPSPLWNVPNQSYSGTAAEQRAQFVRWNGYKIAPGETISFASNGRASVPVRWSATCETAAVELHSLPEV